MTTDSRTLLTDVLTSLSNQISGRPPTEITLPDTAAMAEQPVEVEPIEAPSEPVRTDGSAPAGPTVVAPSGSVEEQAEAFLAALRQHESGNRNVNSSVSSASGFYQYIDSTWGSYGGYRRAHEAPFEVQHERAKQDALAAFERYGNWADVAMAHFYPKFAGNRSMWHYVPGEENGKAFPGNPTGSEYVDSVLSKMKGYDNGG